MSRRPDKILYPLDPDTDYRIPENRLYAIKAWTEAQLYVGELDQQLRVLNQTIDDIEQKLWLSFLWGVSYNSIGCITVMNEFPLPPIDRMREFADWYNKNFDRIRFDTDCRYKRSPFISIVQAYIDSLDGRTQLEMLEPYLLIEDKNKQYNELWDFVMTWAHFGRLSVWNYVEAVNFVTDNRYTIDCQDFKLADSGSESNRNGFCWSSGQEHYQTKHGKLKSTGEPLSREICEMLNEQAEGVYKTLEQSLNHIDVVNRLKVETVFCWLKKRFRARSSRYLHWDAHRTYDEFMFLVNEWPEIDMTPFWEARKIWVPDYELCELKSAGNHLGVDKDKMKVFVETGRMEDVMAWQNDEPWLLSAASSAKSLFS